MFNGAGVAIVTPFKGGKIDFESFERLVEFHLENDTQALIVLGTTGEASTQTMEEKEELIIRAVKKVNKKIPVIIGVGTNNTVTTLENVEQAERLGADGLLLVTPYYNKATQKGLIEHFTKVANSTKLPIILYNVPSRTGLNIDANTTIEMSKLENIAGIKEASGNTNQILEIRRNVGDDFKIFSGNDDQIVSIYACGGNGVISVASNIIPKEIQAMCREFMGGNTKEALKIQLKYKRLIDLLFCEVNPIPVKAALSKMGYIENNLRLPLTAMEEKNLDILVEEMENVNII